MPLKWPFWLILISTLAGSFYFFFPLVEDFFTFYPQRAFDFTPESFGLTYQEARFVAEDGRTLHGWFFPGEKDLPVLLHFHGNAGNISHRLDLARTFVRGGFSLLLFDYRGFGKSEGSPSEQGLYRDGMAAYDYLVQHQGVLPENIVLHGHSIGAAVALEVALKKRARSIIHESAFTSTKAMAKTMPLFFLFAPLIPAHYNNLEKVPRLFIPKLFVHGDRDEIVPFSMGEALVKAAANPKFFYPVKDAGHNDVFIVGGEKYLETIAQFARTGRIDKTSAP